MQSLPISWVREQFPAIVEAQREAAPTRFFDNAAGAQVPHQALDAIQRYIERHYALGGAAYRRSSEAEAIVESVRRRAAQFLGTPDADEVVFGLNATTTLRLFVTALGETLKSGDGIIISALEHEANVSPWLRLQRYGVELGFWPARGPEALLQEGDLRSMLSMGTPKVVAVTAASNLLGTMPDIRAIADIAHAEGALVVVDAVHFAPHRHVDVRAMGVDFLVCSGYKIFGPHVALAYCSAALMERLPSLNHFFLQGHKLELGSQNNEGIAALGGAFDYLDELGAKLGLPAGDFAGVFGHISAWETHLSARMLAGLTAIPGVTVFGITDPSKLDRRVATYSFRKEGLTPEALAQKICDAGFAVRHGDAYAARLAEHLKVAKSGGVVRASLSHYNTLEEVEEFLAVVTAA